MGGSPSQHVCLGARRQKIITFLRPRLRRRAPVRLATADRVRRDRKRASAAPDGPPQRPRSARRRVDADNGVPVVEDGPTCPGPQPASSARERGATIASTRRASPPRSAPSAAILRNRRCTMRMTRLRISHRTRRLWHTEAEDATPERPCQRMCRMGRFRGHRRSVHAAVRSSSATPIRASAMP